MRLGMMQPYFFPYVGYFSLMQATDLWIVFDTAQYIRRGWVNRNRVLCDGSEQWKYVRLPVLHAPRETPICEIQIDERQPWRRHMLSNLDAYERRRAPYFPIVSEWLQGILNHDPAARMGSPVSSVDPSSVDPSSVDPSSDGLSSLLIHLLKQTCCFLGLPLRLQVFSEMQLCLPPIAEPGGWALQAAKALNADTYINAPGGREIFNTQDFRDAGIQLRFLEPTLQQYSQAASEFVPWLSIIDLMMWNSPEKVRQMISSYSLAEF